MPCEIIEVANQNSRQFHETELSTRFKRRPRWGSTVPATKNERFRVAFKCTTPANVSWTSTKCPRLPRESKSARSYHTCHGNLRFWTTKCAPSDTPATKNGHSANYDHIHKVKADRPKHRSAGPPLCASLRSRNAHGHRTRELLCEPAHENTARQIANPDRTLPFTYRKNPSVWTHCLGK